MRIVMPPALNALTSVFTSRVETGSSPLVGSSSTSSSGLPIKAEARATRRAMPLEKPPTGRRATDARPTISSSSSARRADVFRSSPHSPA